MFYPSIASLKADEVLVHGVFMLGREMDELEETRVSLPLKFTVIPFNEAGNSKRKQQAVEGYLTRVICNKKEHANSIL